MSGPYVGSATDEWRGICVYAPTPSDPSCGEPATAHLAVETPEHGVVALASCTDHLSLTVCSGRLVADHHYRGYCGLPGTLWFNDGCQLDDSGTPGSRA